MLNIHLKKFVALLVIVLIISMSSISITGKTTKKEIQTTGSFRDEGVDWWPMFHHDLNHSGYTTSTGPETNNVLWAYQADDWIFYSSPAIVDNKVYFGDRDKNFYCIDSDTGGEIWKTSIPDGISASSPAVENGKVYFGSRGSNAGAYCLNATTGEIIWRYPTPGDVISFGTPSIYEGKVFTGAPYPEPGSMYCLDADTGEEIWISQNIKSPKSAAIYNGRIYFGAGDFYVYCLDADNGEVIWKYKTYEQYLAYIHVTIYDDKLYAGGRDGLYCLDIEDGDLIWKYPTAVVHTTPCTADGKVFFAADDAHVYCLDAISGVKLWDFDTGYYEVHSSPAYADGKIYIGSKGSDAKTYCLDAISGVKLWDFRTTSHVLSSPGVADGKVYVGTWMDGEMLCFGGETDNNPPHTPEEILGPTSAKLRVEYTYNTSTYDPDGDQLYYKWDWEEDGSEWIGPFNSNETMEIKITFYYEFIHTVRVIVKDSNHARSDWVTLEVSVTPRNRIISNPLFIGLFERFPLLSGVLLRLIPR